MKWCNILFLLFSTLVTSEIMVKNKLEEHLVTLLNIWKMGDKRLFPFDLPLLDVIKIPSFKGNYNGKGIKLSYSISEMLLIGLNRFNINNIHASEQELMASVNITIPAIKVYAERYSISGRAYFIYPLKGSGDMTINFFNNRLTTTIYLSSNGTSTKIDNLQFDFHIDKIEANLAGSSWPINKVLSSDGANIISNYHDDIVAAIHYYIIPYANVYLAKITPKELLKTISSLMHTKLN